MDYLVIILLSIGLFTQDAFGESLFHTNLSPKDLQHYFGVETTESVPEYELVHTVHVEGGRHRRSTEVPEKESVAYMFQAFGQDFTIHLQHNDLLIAPGCLTQYFRADGTRVARPCPSADDDCYYHGTSLGHNGSAAALSICSGLHGLIRMPEQGQDLWIQPVAERHLARARRSLSGSRPVPEAAQPHIVYKTETGGTKKTGIPEVDQLTTEVTSASRVRRAGEEKYAEMLLVADKTMHAQYKENLRHFLLTVANIAAKIWLDPSIKTPLHFTVVRIQILEEDQPDLDISEDARRTLDSFCQWQEQTNPADEALPHHHDGAALFTRVDIVYNEQRDTTGLGNMQGMCGVNTRCSVNQDRGLGVGITLAHETGHTVGMSHDGVGNRCENGKYVMSSNGGGGNTSMQWSSCSVQAYQDFLRSSKSSCLNDRPVTSLELPKELPGVLYDGDDQCELFLGPGSTLCKDSTSTGKDVCRQLRCQSPSDMGVCVIDSYPRLDGTMCGIFKYCMSGSCVDIDRSGPPPRHGGWSAWEAEWSACSRSCGGGVRVRHRKCNNPKPVLGGLDCPGESIMAEMCNMEPCNTTQEDFRNTQCSMTDNIPLNGELKHWVPVEIMMGDQQCQLSCQANGSRTIRRRFLNGKPWYIDGTVCTRDEASLGSRCVEGKCTAFGCDGKTGSHYRFDQCGVCGGQGISCRKQSGKYNQGRVKEYVTFLTFPKGSTDVNLTNENKFTMMSVKVGDKRVLNDNGRFDPSGSYTVGRTLVHYKKLINSGETISIEGPLYEEVQAELSWETLSKTEVYQGLVYCSFSPLEYADVLPVISYEYFVPTFHPEADFRWRVQNGACSRRCGGGVYVRTITCTHKYNGSEVDDHLCDLREKPALTGSPCNGQPCPPRWRAGDYGQCSKTCGGGQQSRPVECIQEHRGVEQVIASGNCPANQQPASVRDCNTQDCPAEWVAGAWSFCSLTCGRGVRTRRVQCKAGVNADQLLDDEDCPLQKPALVENCVTAFCSPEISGDACKDTRNDCSAYDQKLCEDYREFSLQNCMRTCAFCQSDQVNITTESCEDKSSECEGHGQTLCTGPYAEWASENCAQFCGHCGNTDSIHSGGLSTNGDVTSESCVDKRGDCAGLGLSVCGEQYTAWASVNCPKFCGLCGAGSGTHTSTANTTYTSTANTTYTSTASTTRAAGIQRVDCTDKLDNCAAYGREACTNYSEWAGANCRTFCGLCSSSQPSEQPINHNVSLIQANCSDKVDNCAAYGQRVCTDYTAWAGDNCQKFCGLCSSSQLLGSQTKLNETVTLQETDCADKLDNCAAYGREACTNYSEWAGANCRKFCGLCSSSQSIGSQENLNETVTLQGCTDKLGNCAEYGQSACTQYVSWARENCQQFCNLCSSSTSEPPATEPNACVDVFAFCDQYGLSVCTSYPDWSADNCQRFCNKCSSHRKRRSALPLPPPPRALCNNVLTAPEGSLSLIGQPVSPFCTQIILAPFGFTIQLSFTALNVRCEKGDYLEVREDEMSKLQKEANRVLCDQAAPIKWTTNGHVATILLTSATPGHGYNLTYKMVSAPHPTPAACSKLMTDPSGTVSSPGFPSAYPRNTLCMTEIYAPPAYRIRIAFTAFHLDENDCTGDSVTLYDEEFNVTDILCGESTDLQWQSQGHKVKIVFASGRGNSGTGFHATYRFIAPW